MQKYNLVSKFLEEMNVSAAINAYESLPKKKKSKKLLKNAQPSQKIKKEV